MIEKGFTEREYEEEFTIETLNQIAVYHDVVGRAQESQRRKAGRARKMR